MRCTYVALVVFSVIEMIEPVLQTYSRLECLLGDHVHFGIITVLLPTQL